MSVTTTYTMHCRGKRPEPCPKTVTSDVSVKDLREKAAEEGWYVDYGYGVSYDACPQHIAPMDRIDWSSCA